MGTDITMHIVSKQNLLRADIFDGRNSEWFDNLTGRCISEPAYEFLPAEYDWDCDGNCPQELIDQYTKPRRDDQICYYFNHRAMVVGKFREWYEKYKPTWKAGYVPRYDKWLWDFKGITPDIDNLEHYRWKVAEPVDRIGDMVWVEFEYKYEPSKWLYEYLIENEIPDDAWIVFCFDC